MIEMEEFNIDEYNIIRVFLEKQAIHFLTLWKRVFDAFKNVTKSIPLEERKEITDKLLEKINLYKEKTDFFTNLERKFVNNKHYFIKMENIEFIDEIDGG